MDKSSETTPRGHTPSGRWKLGFVLVVATVVLWSTVPIALSLLLDRMDAVTITWYRFAVGAVVLGVSLQLTNNFSTLGPLIKGKAFWFSAIASIALTGNFILYLYALNFIPPGTSQIIMNLAPLFVLFGSVVFFRESFRRVQGGGLVLLLVGLMLFFKQRVNEFTQNFTDYSFGALIVLCASAVWASYALAQKQLLTVCSSTGIMFSLYTVGVLIMLPFCTLHQIRQLSTEQYVVLAYSSANTLIAYGCFAEALRHWEATRVSAIVCTTPLLTLTLSYPAHAIWPDRIMRDEVNMISLAGALLVVVGSMLTALRGQQLSNSDED